MNLDWLKTEFKDIQIDLNENFMEDKSPNLTLRIANNTEMTIIEIVTFDFNIPNLQNKFTSNSITNPIIGFDIIENLIKKTIVICLTRFRIFFYKPN